MPGVQIGHVGRKGSTRPGVGGTQLSLEEGGWECVGPSPLPFQPQERPPRAMTVEDITRSVDDWRATAARCRDAGFRVLELHFAHGYLVHSFMSPLTNKRRDEYGGSYEKRVRFPLEIVRAVRQEWPQHLPLFVRISGSDFYEYSTEPVPPQSESWRIDSSIRLSRDMAAAGVDLIDVSSGGAVPNIRYPVGPAWQAPLAAAIKQADIGALVGSVGNITEPRQAEEIVASGKADVVFMGRELLRSPYWALKAAAELGVTSVEWPYQYAKAAVRPPKAKKDAAEGEESAAGGAIARRGHGSAAPPQRDEVVNPMQ